MPSIYDISLASATLLEQYESKGYSDYLQSLLLANTNIQAKILKTKGIWTKSKLNEIKRLINDEMTATYGGLFESIQDESVAIAQISYNGILGHTDLIASLPKEAIKDLINSNREIQLGYNADTKESKVYTFKELFKLSGDNHARQLRVTLAGGIAQGLTAEQIVRQFNIKSSKLSKGQIKSNIFTTITDSKNQGHYQGFLEIEKRGLLKYYEHVSVLDGKTSPICSRLDGRKYKVSIKDIPPSFRPPIHGSCRSQLIPRTKNEEIQELETYPTWFSKQSKAFQRGVLGNKKYKAYQNGTYKMKSYPDIIGKTRTLESYQESLFNYVGS